MKDIVALLKLIEDPDPEVSVLARENLINRGYDAIPELEKVWKQDKQVRKQILIEELIRHISFNQLTTKYQEWIKAGADSLEEGLFLVSLLLNPHLKFETILNRMNPIFDDIDEFIRKDYTPLQKIRLLNHIFFERFKLTVPTGTANHAEYYCINTILKSNIGNPGVLTALYLILTYYMELPVFAHRLPSFYLIGFHSDKNLKGYHADFYVNILNWGEIFSAADVDLYLKKNKIAHSFFHKCTYTEIIKQILESLNESYRKVKNFDKQREILRITSLFQ